MRLDERIQHHAAELRGVYAHRAPEPPEPRPRRNGMVVAVGAALVAIVVIAPVALLTRSDEEPVATSVAGPPTTAPTHLPALTDGASLDELPLVDVPDRTSPGVLTQLNDSAIFTVGGRAFESDDLGGTWKETNPLPDGDMFGPIAATEERLIAIGARGGAAARLYVSDNPWNGWDAIDLPRPANVVQTVPHAVAVLDDGFAVAGAATRSTFDDDVLLYMWRSGDGLEWEATRVAEMRSDFTFAETILDGPDGIIVVAQSSADRLLAFTEKDQTWELEELRPELAVEADIGRTLTNSFLVDAWVEGAEVLLRWAFRDNLGAQGFLRGALVRYTPDSGWESRPMFGAIPRDVVRAGDGYVGIGFPDPVMVPGLSSTVVVSVDGLVWREVASFPNVALSSLVAGRDLEYFVAGSSTERIETTGRADPTGAGLWRVTLADTVERLAAADAAGG